MDTLPFSGPAVPMTDDDVTKAAAALLCTPAAVRAVIAVEVGPVSGFLSDGSKRPRILFEALHFHRFTGGQYDATHPTISSPTWNRALYRDGAPEYDRLYEAVALDRTAAIKSASWGLFQIMGSNFELAGFTGPEQFVTAMTMSEGDQLRAFVSFCQNTGLAAKLRTNDWAGFAKGYNGPGYAENRYDVKLAAAFDRLNGNGMPLGQSPPGGPRVLSIGAAGYDVAWLQGKLNAKLGLSLVADGLFGRATQLAVMRVQEAAGLATDGVVGADTRTALG